MSKPSSARSKRDPDEAASDAGALSDGEHIGGAETGDDGDELERGDQLERSLLRRGLSDIQRTADRANFAFTRLDLAGQGVKSLEGDLAAYPELRYLNVSSNEIVDLSPLSVLPRLLSLHAAHNHLSSLDAFLASPHPQLQLLQLDHNDIDTVLTKVGSSSGSSGDAGKGKSAGGPVSSLSAHFPSLFALTLSNNKVRTLARAEDASFAWNKHDGGHPSLSILDLSFNALESLKGLEAFPRIRILNLASNNLSRLDGVEHLKQLEKLNITDNPKLGNLPREMARLSSLPNLSNLLLTAGNGGWVEGLQAALDARVASGEGGPAAEEAAAAGIDLACEVLLLLPRLQHLDGKRVTASLRARADALGKERLLEQERREQEEAEAKKLALEEEEAERKAKEEDEDAEDEDEDKSDEEEDGAGGDDGGADDVEQDDGGAGGDEQFDDGGAPQDDEDGEEA